MATPLMLNVAPSFNMSAFAEQLATSYRSQGYVVNVMYFPDRVSVKFEKDTGGINTVLGLGEGITAHCTLNNGMLYINYSDEEWTGKIIGFCVGWFVCMVPFVTAIVGTVKQLDLSKKISAEATRIAASFR